jgi:excisionase family DNA binding protein
MLSDGASRRQVSSRLAYTVEEAAGLVGVSHKSIRQAIWRGELRHKRLTERADGRGRIIIPIAALEEWLKA